MTTFLIVTCVGAMVLLAIASMKTIEFIRYLEGKKKEIEVVIEAAKEASADAHAVLDKLKATLSIIGIFK